MNEEKLKDFRAKTLKTIAPYIVLFIEAGILGIILNYAYSKGLQYLIISCTILLYWELKKARK